MFGRFTPKAKESASKAFEKRKDEKTLNFYIKTHVKSNSISRCEEKIDAIFKKIKNPSLSIVKNLFLAGLAERKGDFKLACKLISEFKGAYNSNMYWQAGFLVPEVEFGCSEKGLLGNCSPHRYQLFDNESSAQSSYVISVSCNKKYFDIYGEAFLDSVRKNCGEEVIVHISFVNIDIDYANEKLSAWAERLKVVTQYFFVDDEKEVPVSAVSRIYAIHELIKNFSLPVFYCEIDSAVIKSFQYWVDVARENKVDHVVRQISVMLPWEIYTCGFGLILPTTSGLQASSLMKSYCSGIYNNNDRLMWADQAVLEGVVRFSSIEDKSYNLMKTDNSLLSSFIITPTGSHAKKQHQIKAALKNE